MDIRTASSLSNPPESEQWDDSSERITPRAVLANGDAMYRYASDYPDASFAPPKTEGHNNNGYVPYVDYGRDYNPTFGKQLELSLSDLVTTLVIKATFYNVTSFY